MSKLGEMILGSLSRPPEAEDLSGGTSTYTLDNALDFHRKTIPELFPLLDGRHVLDYGCGPGWQAVAMRRAGAAAVIGVDIHEPWIEHARALAATSGVTGVDFVLGSGTLPTDSFDIVLSSNSFEHFGDPAAMLREMARLVKPGGEIWITFAEPWYSPYGSHMSFFTRLPWVNVLFSERTVMSVRARYRDDGARRYEDVPSGLNRMSLAKFERIIRESGLQVEFVRYHGTKGLPVVGRAPLVRELLVSAVSCRLRKG